MKKFILHICLFAFPILIFMYIFVWIYEIPERQAIKNGTHKKLIKWNDIQNSNNEYDLIILGSSRGYCAYNPVIIDSITNLKSYNMCTGLQNIVESYYILKDILRFQKPKIVIYETFLPSFRNNPDYFHVMSNAKFMSTKGEFDMILNGFGAAGLTNLLIPVLKYKTYLKNNDTNNFELDKNNIHWNKGYRYSNKIIDTLSIKNFPSIYSLKNTNVLKKNIEYYLNLLFELCKDNNIKLICVRAPYPPTRLEISPPDDIHNYFQKFYNDKGISFFDFNYINEVEYDDFDFEDHTHMNNFGSNKVSKQLAEILNKYN